MRLFNAFADNKFVARFLKEYLENIINLISRTEHPFLRLILINILINVTFLSAVLYKMLSRVHYAKNITFRAIYVQLNISSINITSKHDLLHVTTKFIDFERQSSFFLSIFVKEFCLMF